MKHQFATTFIASLTLSIASAAVFAQHAGHSAPMGHAPGRGTMAAGSMTAAATPYAGEQTRSIKALSAQQTQDLLEGKGMGLAMAAELNGYPGPMHVLEHQQALALSATQRDATAALLKSHKAEVSALGVQLVEAERELDQAFASRQIDANGLTQRTQRIGALQAAIRNAHLQTHLQQTALLTPAQVAQYNQVRGYGPTPAQAPDAAAAHKH